MYLVSFLFCQDCLCARPLRTRHGPYPMTCSKRFLAKKGEKRLSFAFSIPSRAQFGRRRKRQDSVARRCSPIIRQPQKLQSRASLAFSLSLSTSRQPHSDLLHAIYNIRRRKKENDTLLCFCRRDSNKNRRRRRRSRHCWSNIILSQFIETSSRILEILIPQMLLRIVFTTREI